MKAEPAPLALLAIVLVLAGCTPTPPHKTPVIPRIPGEMSIRRQGGLIEVGYSFTWQDYPIGHDGDLMENLPAECKQAMNYGSFRNILETTVAPNGAYQVSVRGDELGVMDVYCQIKDAYAAGYRFSVVNAKAMREYEHTVALVGRKP